MDRKRRAAVGAALAAWLAVFMRSGAAANRKGAKRTGGKGRSGKGSTYRGGR